MNASTGNFEKVYHPKNTANNSGTVAFKTFLFNIIKNFISKDLLLHQETPKLA